MGQQRPVTMSEVARLAGVSPATVSRVMSGSRAVDPARAERVVAAAARLDYRVNLVGRALRSTRTSTVGLVVPDLENPFFSALAQQLSRAFSSPGVDLLVFSADSSLEIEARGVRSFLGRQVDALVLIPVDEERSGDSVALAARAVRTVQLDRRVPGTSAAYVGCSNRRGLDLIHEHVVSTVDLDDQPVVFVGAAPSSSSAHERLDAARRRFGDDLPCLLGNFSIGWGRQAAADLLDLGWRRGTVVAAADVIALGVLSHLLHRGFAVPDDFRVIGFDGIGPAAFATPSLTTVRQPVEQMAATIRRLVLDEAGDDAQPVEGGWFDPEFVPGESSPPAGGVS